ITLDGAPLPARAGESVAVALLAAGRPLVARSAKYHRPRGPFCLAGSCGSCLVRVDGVPNVRACETPCREGLRVETQNAVGGASHDLLGVIDLFAPSGIDHHKLATWSQVANRLAVSASRSLAGLGELPDPVPPRPPPAVEVRCDALVVGSGPAGLGAAERLARAGRRVLLAEAEPALGGRLRCRLGLPGDPPPAWADEVARAVERAGGACHTRATVLGVWRDAPPVRPERSREAAESKGGVLAAVEVRGAEPRMLLVRAARAVLASGTWAQPPLFPGNDLPGVHGARGLLVALAEDGVVPGERAAVLGEGREAAATAERLAASGMQVELVRGAVARARGGRRLAALDLGGAPRLRCDVLAVATPRMPAAELARELGAPLELHPDTGAFRVKPEPGGRFAEGVWAAGEVCGPCTAAEAVEAGAVAGEAAARCARASSARART
ncbi:MAG TPA: 2Fe-2S iron-sulfur cluster-binding protein, partial [Myxococcales bacterium]